MKIRIAYSAAEKAAAQAVAALIQRTIKSVTRKDKDNNGAYYHIYLQTPKQD